MTQYEYIMELSDYLKRTYDVTVIFEKSDRWRSGYGLQFVYKQGSRAMGFDVDSYNWKEKLFERTNEFLKSRKLIVDDTI